MHNNEQKMMTCIHSFNSTMNTIFRKKKRDLFEVTYVDKVKTSVNTWIIGQLTITT